jgi:hypothetical protein
MTCREPCQTIHLGRPEDRVVDAIGNRSSKQRSTTDVAGQDAVLDFLICWHLASGDEGRPHVLAALRRWASGRERVDDGGGGPRLWSWCTSVWLPEWMRAAELPEEARAVERCTVTMLPRARRAAEAAVRRRTSGVSPVSTVIARARAFAAVEASGAAALTCSGVEGGQARQALAAARDAAHAALQGGVHIDRVVTRLRHGALALVDDLASGRTPDPTPDQGHHHAQRRGAPIVSRAPSPSALSGSRE